MNFNQTANLIFGGLATVAIITAVAGQKESANIIKAFGGAYAAMTRAALGKNS